MRLLSKVKCWNVFQDALGRLELVYVTSTNSKKIQDLQGLPHVMNSRQDIEG